MSRSFLLQFLTLYLRQPYFLNPAYLFPPTKLPWDARMVIYPFRLLTICQSLMYYGKVANCLKFLA